MRSVGTLLIPPLISSIIIRCRSILLILLNLSLNLFINRLTMVYHLVKFLGGYIQLFFGIVSGNHYSLVNVSDGDFSLGKTAHQLYKVYQKKKDNSDLDNDDLFHIYLSKILYEPIERIKQQCFDWGFDEDSVQIFTYVQSDDLKKYTYSTEAIAIHYAESNRIIIGFRGTEPMDLFQWLTDASTNFIDVDYQFNDLNKNNAEKIRVHAGFYSALGLNQFNPSKPIDFNQVTLQTPIFIQLLNFIRTFDDDNNKCQISVTGHSLGGGLASLFSFVLLAYGYESSISGVYTYGQPLVGNRRYAEILIEKLGHRFHRWVNHSDIVTRIPVIELPSIAWYYARTPYSDALEFAGNNNPTPSDHHYYHSGLRFRIDCHGNLQKQSSLDKGPILAHQDKIDLFNFTYSITNIISSLFNISPIRSFLWLTFPNEINDHFPGDYARKIKKIIKNNR